MGVERSVSCTQIISDSAPSRLALGGSPETSHLPWHQKTGEGAREAETEGGRRRVSKANRAVKVDIILLYQRLLTDSLFLNF